MDAEGLAGREKAHKDYPHKELKGSLADKDLRALILCMWGGASFALFSGQSPHIKNF